MVLELRKWPRLAFTDALPESGTRLTPMVGRLRPARGVVARGYVCMYSPPGSSRAEGEPMEMTSAGGSARSCGHGDLVGQVGDGLVELLRVRDRSEAGVEVDDLRRATITRSAPLAVAPSTEPPPPRGRCQC